MNEDFTLELISALDQNKSRKQINSDIKVLEKTINMLRLTGTFAKGDTKKELNDYISQLSNQLSMIKLKAKMDSKELKSEIDKTLSNLSFKEIDALNINENKTKLKMRKVVADLRSYADRVPIGVNVEYKKQKLDNDLTTYLNKNTKINESSTLLKEAEKVRELINSVGDKKTLREATDAFQLYKSEVAATGFNTKSTTDKIKNMLGHISKISSAFGVASMAVNNFVKSLKTLKSNDTILTEISKTSDLTKQQLKEIGDESFKIASKYGKLSSNYLLGVQEMARAGYGNSDTMAELSTKVQGAGDMTAELANKYIVATDKAFQMNGSIEKLTTTLDGANNITNHNALSMSDLAEAMSIVGSQAASSGMEVDETTAALATMIAVTQQSGSQMGNAFKGILMNLRQVTGEVEDGGEAIDAESLTKYEKACADLGVSLSTVKDGVVSLKEPMQIIKELSDAYTKLDETDVKRANLLNAVGGKYRANALNSLLEHYDMYSKMMNEYADGLGSMDEEAEKTALSWEGRLNSLQNSWDSFVNTLTNKEAMLGGISFFDRLIQGAEALVDQIGEIPVLLTTLNTSMVALNKDYGITQVWNADKGKIDIEGNLFGLDFTQAKNMKKHFEEAEEAILDWNCELANGSANIDVFENKLAQNNAQFRTYLQTTSKDAPASLAGYKASLNAAGVSTDALRLKTVLLNAAISMGIGLAIQAAIEGITYLVQKQEELRQSAIDAAEEFNNLKSKSESLNSELKSTGDRIEELEKKPNLTFVEQEELQKLREANEELERQIELNKVLLDVAEGKARDAALDFLNKKTAYEQYGEWDTSQVLNDNSNYGQRNAGEIFQGNQLEVAKLQLSEYEDLLKRKADVEKRIQDFQLANSDADQYTAGQKGQFANLTMELNSYDDALHGLKTTLYKTVPELDQFRESLNPDYDQSYIDSINEIVDRYAGLFGGAGENVTDKFNEVWESAGFSSARKQLEELSKAGELTPEVLESNEQYQELLEATGVTVDELIQHIHALTDAQMDAGITSSPILPFNKEEMISAINEMSEGFEELDKIYSSISDHEPFNYKLLDDDKFKETFSGLGDAYTDFIETVSNSPSDITACQSAFDGLLTEWIDSIGILDHVSESTADLTTAMLSNMGVANAQELVDASLAERKAEATWKSRDLTNATADEILALAEEAGAVGTAEDAFISYIVQKMMAEAALDPSGDISALASIVNSLGIATNAWRQYYATKARMEAIANDPSYQSYNEDGSVVSKDEVLSQYADIAAIHQKQFAEDLEANFKNTKFTGGGVKSSRGSGGSGGGSGSKAKKDAAEVYDWIETLIKRTDEKIDELQKKATDAKGWRAKNEIQDTVFDELQAKLEQSKSAYDRYMQEANSVGLSDIYVNKIQNGEIDIEKLDDTEGNEVLKEKIRQYTEWYEKAKECEKAIEEINDEAKKTREIKLDNIIKDYDQLVSLMKAYTDYRKDLVSVRDRMGERLDQDDYQELIYDQQEIYDTLAEKYEELNNELNSGGIEQGTEKWYEMKEELIGIKSEMINCANAVEDFKDQIFELRFKPLEDLVSKLDSVNSELSNMVSLIGDDGLVKDGMLTDRGLTTVAMYSRQIINAKKEAEEYKAAIKALNASYRNGDITLDEYNEKLYEYRSAQQEAALATKEARDAIIALREEAINQEIDAMEELIQAKIDLLDEEKELYEYQKKIASDNRNIAMLERQIQVLSLSSDRADIAQRLQLEAELAKAREDLAEYQREHSVESQKNALEEEGDAYKEAKEKELEDLRTNLDAQEELIKQYLNDVTNNYSTVYDTLTLYADEYNMSVTEDLTTPFSSAEMATQSFQSVFADTIASIQYQINSIDWSNMTRGMDEFGGGYGGDGDYEDISSQGKWQKGKGGKWWFGENYREDGDYWYAEDGYYNINGKTYGFDEDGYMKTEWDDSQGDWHYFDKDTGEMQKSQWIQGKRGEWYYLTADGSMARDAAVKAKDGNGYYLVDEDGAWRESDGILTKKQVDELGYDIAYRSGTKHAQKGVALTDEEELGSEVLITKDGALRQLDYGDRVFNSDQVDMLWKLSQMNDQFLENAPWNQRQIDTSIIRSNEPNININNSVVVQGDASERTVGLIQNAIDDFAKNRMGGEFKKQLRYSLK